MRSKRFPHKLKENRSVGIPHRLVFFDTETYEQEHTIGKVHKLRLGVACYVRLENVDTVKTEKWITFRSHTEFFDFLESCTNNKECTYVYAHNLDFDFSVVSGYAEMKSRGYHLIKWFSHNQGLYLKFRKGTRSVVFSDTLMLFPMSLKELGKYAGLDKLEMPKSDDDESRWLEYCRRDVEILRTAMLKYLKFLKEQDLGKFAITIGQQSFNAFRHKFMKEDIFIHGNEELDKIEEESYYGGRTEAFYIGEINQPVYYLDVNSMYPFVMRNFFYPVKYLFEVNNITTQELSWLIKRFCVIAQVVVETDKPLVPLRRDRVIFPIGRFTGWYTTGEIRMLLENKAIKEVKRVLVYKRAMIFKDYVDYFYRMKLEGKKQNDLFKYLMAKLFLNCLYGKFGQRTKELTEVNSDEVSIEELENPVISLSGRKVDYIVFQDKIWQVHDREPSRNSFIAIASHVTGYARAYLWRIMQYIGRDHIYYCDTDSVFVDEEGFRRAERIIDNYKLGALGIKGCYKKLLILGAKAYVTEDERKIKGIPARATPISDNAYQFEQFMRFKTKLRKKLLNEQVVVLAQRVLSGKYEKGNVTPSGRVIPYQVWEGQ